MPTKKTSNDTNDTNDTNESVSAQAAALATQAKDLAQQAKALREQAKALRPAKPVKTLEQIIEVQNATPQKYIVRSIAGRVLERMQYGQDQASATVAVLEQMEEWTREEIARRLTAKTAKAEKDAAAE